MKLVIPMAGFGSRMRPHTWTRPKPLLPVAGRPMLAHILDRYTDLSITEYVFIVGWLGDQIRDYAQNHIAVPTKFVEQNELKGQAHAIWLAREHLDGPLFLMWVDTLFDDVDFTDLDADDADGIIFTYEVEDPRRFGVVETDAQGVATRLVEKPESMDNKTILMGVYYFKQGQWLAEACKTLMDRQIQTKGEYYLADAINLMIEQGARFKSRAAATWLDTGKPETTLITHRYLLEHGADNSYSTPHPGVTIIPPVFIHPEAVVERSVIGPYVSVASKARVTDSIVRDTLIDEGAELSAMMVTESIIGRDVRMQGTFQSLNIGDTSSID